MAASVQGLREGGAITRSTLRLAAACVAYLSQTVLNYSGGLLLLHIIDVLRAYSTKPILQFSNAAHAEDAEDDYCEVNLVQIILQKYESQCNLSKICMCML